MSEKPNDGGPAFPRPVSTDDHSNPCNIAGPQDGMSLRDYFAAMALKPLMEASLSRPKAATTLVESETKYGITISDTMSRMAYEFADAMLKARQQ